MDALDRKMLTEVYWIIGDPENPARMADALPALEARMGKLETKFTVAAGFLTALSGIGVAFIGAWNRIKGS